MVTSTMLIPLDAVRVEQLHAQVAEHGRGEDGRCTGRGCRDRHPCWHQRDAVAILTGAGYKLGGGHVIGGGL